MQHIRIFKMKCKQCGHEWIPRREKIYICPKCKSPKWDEEKEEAKEAKHE